MQTKLKLITRPTPLDIKVEPYAPMLKLNFRRVISLPPLEPMPPIKLIPRPPKAVLDRL